MATLTLPAHTLEIGDRVLLDGRRHVIVEIDEGETAAYDLFLDPPAVLPADYDQQIAVAVPDASPPWGLWADRDGNLHRARGRCDWRWEPADESWSHREVPGCGCGDDTIHLYSISLEETS